MYPNHVFFSNHVFHREHLAGSANLLSFSFVHDSDPSPNVDIQIKKRYFDVLTKVNDEMKSIALHRSTELQLFSRVTSQTLNFKSEL